VERYESRLLTNRVLLAAAGGGCAAACLCLVLLLAILAPAQFNVGGLPGIPAEATVAARPSEPPVSGAVAADVVSVTDGDTIVVSIAGETFRVRYIGMDTPERGMPLYDESTAANEELVTGQTVYLVPDVSETDRFGRLLRYVFLTDGTFVNGELVRLGYAVARSYPPDVRYDAELLALEDEARAAGAGFWAEVVAVATQGPAQTPPHSPAGGVQITYIFFDGQEPNTEGDEYAQIQNMGGAPVNLAGWRLNAGAEGQDFLFPPFTMEPGQICRVYTNRAVPEQCGFNFASDRPLWSNGGDCGYLYDAAGVEVSRFCY
jgi:endonuclease YncB( thermonuclease family)